jgi:hypothetical protein
MPSRRAGRSQGWSTRQKVIVAVAVAVFAPPLIAGCISAAPQGGKSTGAAPYASGTGGPLSRAASPTTASGRTGTTEPAAHPDPSFSYPGDPQCVITYGSRGPGSMYWTANITTAGTLRTHASDTAGDLYAHVAPVTPGPNGFVAKQPLWKIDDIGGVLYAADGKSYACSIAPAS